MSIFQNVLTNLSGCKNTQLYVLRDDAKQMLRECRNKNQKKGFQQVINGIDQELEARLVRAINNRRIQTALPLQ